MEQKKILNLLNEPSDANFVTSKWKTFNDQSNSNYCEENEIIYSTTVLKSNIYNYNDAYILVRADISVIGCNALSQVAIKNCAPIISVSQKLMEQ